MSFESDPGGRLIEVALEGGEPRTALSDAAYWLLSPVFHAMRVESGQFVEPFGEVAIHPRWFDPLDRMLAAARELVAKQPETWSAVTGMGADGIELRETVVRADVQAALDEWAGVAAEARRTGRPVVCRGGVETVSSRG